MPGEDSEFRILRPEAPAQPAGRIPPRVEPGRAHEPPEALPRALPRHHYVARHLEVFVHRLAGDEQVHDLARPLEDQIDSEVAHDALDRDGPFAPGAQRVGRLVAAAAADEIGSVRRPVFRVIRASFRPLPSPHSTFSFGTRTFLNEITPL